MILVALLLAADLGLGTWRFNAALSTYESGPAPKESTRVWEKAGDQVRFRHTTVSADGRTNVTEFVASYDGSEGKVTGSSRYDTVSLKLIDDRTVEQTFRLKGEVTVRATRTISADGQRMTIVARGTNPDGKKFVNTLVYDRIR
ncbi:MAG: hypothetical protein SFV18_19985 [Bryobacteraceae bacterium]|nr:hypothetical protein [Bryobacteraceae bacterium]